MRFVFTRRGFLRAVSGFITWGLCGRYLKEEDRARAQSPGPIYLPLIHKAPSSTIYGVRDIGIPDFGSGNYHPGVESLLTLMGQKGLKFYRHSATDDLAGPDGLIAANDVVLVKVNAQWKHRGCTNTDVLRGLIQRILDHPGGFRGEVVILENGQGRGSFESNQNYDGDTSVAGNAENPAHTFNYLVRTVFSDQPVSAVLLDSVRWVQVSDNDHSTNGYRTLNPHPERQSWHISYPCFTTHGGHRVELARGLWTGSGYAQNLKLLNLPVLKTHGGCGVTGALKLFYGVLSMWFSDSGYHYGRIGDVLGQMFAHVRAPDLNIMDAIWVSYASLRGYPPSTTSRQNTLLASTDPVALDYWASKYVLYPISQNPNHHPDMVEQYTDSNLAQYLSAAGMEINACNPIGGRPVNWNDSLITCCWT